MSLLRSLLLVLVAVPAVAQTATIVVSEPRGEDRIHIVAELENRRQIDVDLPLAQATVADVRAAINAKRTRTPATVPVGTVIDLAVVAPVVSEAAPRPPSLVTVWQEKARRLARLKLLGLTNATAVSEIRTLEDDVNATYQAGYATGF